MQTAAVTRSHLPPAAPQVTVALPVTAEMVEAVAARVAELIAGKLPPVDRSEYLTPAEAADYMRAKRGRVYELLAQGRLTRLKDGSRTLVRRSEIDDYLARP